MARHRANERGLALVMVIAVSAVVALALASFGMFITQSSRDNRLQTEEAQAFYLAEAGIQRVIGKLQDPTTNWASVTFTNPMSFAGTDTSNQVWISLTSQSATSVSATSYGYVLSRGYTLSTLTPASDNVRAQAAISATLTKNAPSALWSYATYSNDSTNFHAEVHGSVYAGGNNIKVDTNEAIYNDYTYVSSKTPSWLQTYLGLQDPAQLGATVKAYAGNIQVSGSGKLGTASNPLSGAGVNSPKTVPSSGTTNVYYNGTASPVPAPSPVPTIAATQLDGTRSPSTEADFRYFAATCTSSSWADGYVKDADATTDGDTDWDIDSSFTNMPCSSGNGIRFDTTGSGTLTVKGTVFVDGDLTIGSSTYPDIGYVGKGMIVVNGDVTIKSGLHPSTMTNFPETDMLQILTRGTIKIDPPNTTPYPVIAGAFYAGTKIDVKQNCIFVGSLVSANDVKNTGIPIIYQNPKVANFLMANTPDLPSSTFNVNRTDWLVTQ